MNIFQQPAAGPAPTSRPRRGIARTARRVLVTVTYAALRGAATTAGAAAADWLIWWISHR